MLATKSAFHIFIVMILVFSNRIYAAEPSFCVSENKTTNIYFGNGVGNSLREAYLSKQMLASAYLVKKDIRTSNPGESFNFTLAYNLSRGHAEDVIEVINQKVEETGGLTSPEILSLMRLSESARLVKLKELKVLSPTARIRVELSARAIVLAIDAYIDAFKSGGLGLTKYYDQVTENNHVSMYLNDLKKGKRVIVVAHSQGNLFANNAYERLTDINSDYNKSIGIVGVASPAGRGIGDNTYVTALDDGVINALRDAGYSVLPGNVNNKPDNYSDNLRDRANHGFAQSYLASELSFGYRGGKSLRSRSLIDGIFINYINGLEFPNLCGDADNDGIVDLEDEDTDDPCVPNLYNEACYATAVVEDVSPIEVALGQDTIFTIQGESLPLSMIVTPEGSEACTAVGSITSELQMHKCTPMLVGDHIYLNMVGRVDGDPLPRTPRRIKVVMPAPTNVVAGINGASIELNWTAVEKTTSYNVYVTTEDITTPIHKYSSSTPSYTFNDPVVGARYYFSVTSVMGEFESEFSSEVSAGITHEDSDNDGTIDALDPGKDDPCVPNLENDACYATALVSSVSPVEVTVDQEVIFTIVGSNLPLDMIVAPEGSDVCTALGTNSAEKHTHKCIPKLVGDEVDLIMVGRVGGVPLSGSRDRIKVNPGTVVPVPPTNLVANVQNGEIQVIWSAVSGVSNYNVYVSTQPNIEIGVAGVSQYSSSALSYTFSDSVVGTRYYFAISSVQNDQESGLSNEVSTEVTNEDSDNDGIVDSLDNDKDDPCSPEGENDACYATAIVNSVTPTEVTVNEEVVFTVNGSNLPLKMLVTPIGSGACVVLGLNSSENQTYKCIPKLVGDAINLYMVGRADGDPLQGTPVKIVVKENVLALSAPVNVVPTSGENSINLTWSEVDGADKYNIYISTQPGIFIGVLGVTQHSSNTVPFTINNLEAGTRYYIAVTVEKDGLESALSTEITATPMGLSTVATGKLNDTGVIYKARNITTGTKTLCTDERFPDQDCNFGRDSLDAAGQLDKKGAGDAGFDFTKISANGKVVPRSTTEWSCVLDNHTGLMWEVKKDINGTQGESIHDMDDFFTWYNTDTNRNGGSQGSINADRNSCYGYTANDESTYCNTEAYVERINQAGICGHNDWRVPSRGELLGTVNHGAGLPSAKIIPGRGRSGNYLVWAVSPYVMRDDEDIVNSQGAWYVNIASGTSIRAAHTRDLRVILVRGGL